MPWDMTNISHDASNSGFRRKKQMVADKPNRVAPVGDALVAQDLGSNDYHPGHHQQLDQSAPRHRDAEPGGFSGIFSGIGSNARNPSPHRRSLLLREEQALLGRDSPPHYHRDSPPHHPTGHQHFSPAPPPYEVEPLHMRRKAKSANDVTTKITGARHWSEQQSLVEVFPKKEYSSPFQNGQRSGSFDHRRGRPTPDPLPDGYTANTVDPPMPAAPMPAASPMIRQPRLDPLPSPQPAQPVHLHQITPRCAPDLVHLVQNNFNEAMISHLQVFHR